MFFQFELRKFLALLAIISLPVLLFNTEGALSKVARPFVEIAHGVQAGLDYISLGVLESVSEYVNVVSIKRLNRKLLKEVSELKIEQVLHEEIKLENGRLKKLLDLKQSSSVDVLAAVMSSRDILLNSKTLTLSKGYHDGVLEKMGVIGLNCIIGETLKVSKYKSQVLTLNSHFFVTEGIVQRSRQRIIVQGDGGEGLEAKHLPSEADVLEGDLIVTSGSSGVFSKGLPIGTVTELVVTKSGITRTAKIKPLTDIKNIEEFFIILDSGIDSIDSIDSNTVKNKKQSEPEP